MLRWISLDPDPAGGVHLLLLGNALFERLAVGRDALVRSIVDTDLGPQIFFEPLTELDAEGGVLGAVGEVQSSALSRKCEVVGRIEAMQKPPF